MIIQVNTDKNIPGSKELNEKFSGIISAELDRFSNYITRIELYLSDEDGIKDGLNDKRCLLEARLKKRQPIAVKNYGSSHELAVQGAVDKLKNSLDSIIGRLKEH